jgi:DNA polymerase-3 subunit gamma/tau
MLSDEDLKENNRMNNPVLKTRKLDNSNPKNDNTTSERIENKRDTELIKETAFQEYSKTSKTLNLDDIWKKVISMLELPSTKMLLSQQAKLINLNADTAEIAISEKWINMIQSRKNLIEDAFYKARGSSTKVLLIQQKDNLYNHRKNENNPQQIEQKKDYKINREPIKNNYEKRILEQKSNVEKNSIDQKAKQFADFFNGEIVNLE